MLTTGSRNLDELLGGGIERGVLTQVYGVFASGKTTLAMQVGLLNRGKIAYVDTEGGFSPERLEQMASNWGLEEALGRFILFEPSDFREQKRMIAGLKKVINEKFSLIVVDSITSLYRSEEKKHELLNELSKQLQVLLWLARKYNLGVIIINQVYFDSSANTLRPLAEHTLGYKCKDILRLETLPKPSYRLAVLERHRFRPEGGMVHFRITDRGIEDVD